MHAAVIKTGDGRFTAWFSECGLARLDFPRGGTRTKPTAARPSRPQLRRWHRLAEEAVMRVLAGEPAGRLPPLDLSAGTEFQRSVWEAMRHIPPGETKTYAQVAREIRRPAAVRAVGQACGANPIPLLIPCHRVIAANGRLGGFSCGVAMKRKLLRREGSA